METTLDRGSIPKRILPAIVLSQLSGTTLWFAVNAVMPELQHDWDLHPGTIGLLTSAVQLGFITGTLLFALLTIADRYSPRRVFLFCALFGALSNALGAALSDQLLLLLALRFLTGFFLAGIYPVGMKIAAGWYDKGLGSALGYLVGALVLGTASPYALRALGVFEKLPWQTLVLTVSAVAVSGGVVMYTLVPDSNRLPNAGGINVRALKAIWSNRAVRASAFGYFGHMWELYTFWVLVPAIVSTRLPASQVPGAAFVTIGLGFLGCVIGGRFTARYGSARVATLQLAISGLCCLFSPLMLDAPIPLFALWLGLWGITVVGDSPQFSALTANNAPVRYIGSVLTFVNCIGFAITIVSIQIFTSLVAKHPLASLLPWLAIGPVFGIAMMRPLLCASDEAYMRHYRP